MKKLTLHSEAAYLLANVVLAFSVAMTAAADFGVSMIVAPAYILHLKIGFLTFGQCEYLVQGILFIVFCLLMKKVRLIYFSAFLTSLVYGAVLDLWRLLIPAFNPAVTAPGSFSFPLRLVLFGAGEILTAFSIALFFKVYLYPQVVDFFVKGIAWRFKLNLTRFKMICDGSMLLLSAVLSLIFFHGFRGIGWGTLVLTATNGLIIGLVSKLLDKTVEIRPLFPKFAEKFAL
ncbi:MAG: hypothetical protein J6Z79_06830 [Clostridia bacterium]|nr:hypothetical protein [Clostridia bacterium]